MAAEDSTARLRYGFLALHGALMRRIDPDGLLPLLVSASVVSLDEKDIVQRELTAARKVDRLLTSLHRRAVSDPDAYARMLAAMREAYAQLGDDLRGLADEVEAESRKEEVSRRFQGARTTVLEEAHGAALRAHCSAIAGSLLVDEVLPQLVSAGAVTLEENAAIRHAGRASESERARRLVDVIRDKGSLAFAKFAAALLESESYRPLGRLLAKGDPYLETLVKVEGQQQLMQLLSVEETLDDEKYSELEGAGGCPFTPRCMKCLAAAAVATK